MKLITKIDKGKIFSYAEKIMSRKLNKLFMIRRIKASRFFMKSIVKIMSQVKRCRVLEVLNKIESIFKWQVMIAEHVEE